MNTHQADYRTDIARLAEDMTKRDADSRTNIADLKADAAKRDADSRANIADLKTDIARRDADAARRDKDNQRFLVTLFGVLVAIFIGGFVVSNIVLSRTIAPSAPVGAGEVPPAVRR